MTRLSESGRRMRFSPEREDELYDATLELLGEVGYDRLTMPAVAARVRCSTATIYRQWQGKLGLVTAALARLGPPNMPLPDVDTGSLRGDLLEICRRIDAAPVPHNVVAALAHAALGEPDLAQSLRDHFRVHRSTDDMLTRAVERGEIPAASPINEFVPTLPLAVFIAHVLLEGRRADEAYLERFVDAVLLPAFIFSSTTAENGAA